MLFRWDESNSQLRDLTDNFSELMYHVTDGMAGNSHMIMRYGADPGFFAMMRDVTLPSEQFPFHAYEFTESFRRHRTGEVAGILQARALAFYDHHALCIDRPQAYEEFLRMLAAQQEFLRSTGRHYELELIVVESALAELEPLMARAVRELDVDAYVTVLSAPRHYYCLVSNFCDPHGLHNLQIQVDHENGCRFGLAGAPKRYPDLSILHMSAGALERWLASFLLDGLERAKTASLPMWLAPTQVRILPLTAAQALDAWRTRDELDRAGVRADVDDRSRSLGHRLAAAAREWVPRVAVLGKAEVDSGELDVLDRTTGLRAKLSTSALLADIASGLDGYPTAATVEPSVAARPNYG